MAERYQFLRVPDGTLLKLAAALTKGDPKGSASFQAGDGISLELSPGKGLAKEWNRAIGSSSYLIKSGTISVPSAGFSLKFYRGLTYRLNPQYSNWRWEPGDHPFIDGMEIDGPSDGSASIDILSTLNQFLSMAPPVEMSPSASTALDRSSSILNRVSEAVATLTEHTAERQLDLDKTRKNLERDARDKIASHKQALDEQAAIEAERIAKIEKALAARAAELDDRENTHVRRKLQERMIEVATTNLDKSLLDRSNASFQQTRAAASVFALLLLAFTAYQSVVLASGTTGQARDVVIFTEVRIVLLGIAAGALIWYSLRLSSARFRQIAKWENDLNRFRLDVERASFLVEGDLEARKHGETGLPDVMLQRFSQGLFASGHSDNSSETDDVGTTLGHLLSRAASVKIGTDGVSVEVDKSGIRKARRDIAKDAGSEE